MNAGPINFVIAIVGIIVSFFAGKSNISARFIGILLLIGGIVIIMMTVDSISGTGEAQRALRSGLLSRMAQTVRYTIETGVAAYITFAGGAFIGLGGLTYLIGGEDD